MKKLISILLTVSMVFTMLSIPLAAFAETVYEYTETFDSATNSFTLGSWTYNADSQNISTSTTNQLAKFTDPKNVLANATNYEISAEFVLSQYAQNAIVFKANDTYSNYIMFRRSSDGYTEFFRMGSGQGQLAKSTVTSNLKSNATNTIKVTVKGNTYTGYMNGVEMLTYTDTSATADYNAGVRSNIANDKVSVTVDNFNVTNLDKPSVTEELDTFENADNWTLGSYWKHDTTNKNIYVNDTTVRNAAIVFGDNNKIISDTNDYIVSADITTVGNANSQHAVTFRHSGNNFYMFRVTNNYVHIYSMGSTQKEIGKSTTTTPSRTAGDTYNLKVVVNGNTFTGYYNGVEMLTVTDTSYTTGGVGLRSNGNVSVDNFYVQRLDANADLKSISIDGTAISGFDADTTDYSVSIDEGAAYPTVSAAALNSDLTVGNGITIEQASDANNGVATITVVSESGNNTKTYKVSFVEPIVEALDTFESASEWALGSLWKHDAENGRVYATASSGMMSYNDNTGVIARSNGDYVVSADLVYEGGNDVGATSLVFRKQDNSNYYMFRVNGGKADFYRMGGSGNASFGTGEAEIPNLALGSVINLKVVAKGSTFVGYVNGVKQLEATDSEFATGSVGIRSNLNGGGTVYADNFYVCRADAEMKLAAVAVPDGSGVLVSQIPSNNNYVLAVPDNNVYTVTAAALDSTDTVTIEQTDDFNKPATITITNADNTKTVVYNVYFVQRNGADIPELQGYAYCESEDGNTLTFTGSVLNTGSDTRGIAMLAAYDTATGELIAVTKSPETKFSGKCAVTPVEFGAIEAESDSVDIKVFLWDNLTDVTPLSAVNAFTLKKKVTESKAITDVLGVTAWGSVYRLDDTKTQLVEMADEISNIGSNKIKVLLGPSYETAYLYEDFGDTEYATMTELAKAEQYSTLFSDERFDTIAISASEMTQQNWKNGFKQSEKEYVENEFYEFASYLLTTYKILTKHLYFRTGKAII